MPNQRQSQDQTSEEFQKFAGQVHASFERETGVRRRLDAGEVDLIRAWFELGATPGVIDEVIRDRASRQSIGTLKYFRQAVPDEWARQQEQIRELVACAHEPDLPEINHDRNLEDLIATIPDDLPGRRGLVAEIRTLRDRLSEPEVVEQQLHKIELRFLDGIQLTIEQKQQLDHAMSQIALRVPRTAFPEHRQRLSIQLKREGLRLPVLSLFT